MGLWVSPRLWGPRSGVGSWSFGAAVHGRRTSDVCAAAGAALGLTLTLRACPAGLRVPRTLERPSVRVGEAPVGDLPRVQACEASCGHLEWETPGTHPLGPAAEGQHCPRREAVGRSPLSGVGPSGGHSGSFSRRGDASAWSGRTGLGGRPAADRAQRDLPAPPGQPVPACPAPPSAPGQVLRGRQRASARFLGRAHGSERNHRAGRAPPCGLLPPRAQARCGQSVQPAPRGAWPPWRPLLILPRLGGWGRRAQPVSGLRAEDTG